MSLRCAVCGSTRITSETKKEGYDVKKGVVGTVLVGVPGALAGAGGKSNTYYHCADCGQVLNKTMDAIDSSLIDMSIKNPDKYKEQLIQIKKRYKNIEWNDSTVNDLQVQNTNTLTRVEQIEDEILTYLNQLGVPAERDKLEKKYENEYWDFSKAMDVLRESGRIADFIHMGDKIYVRSVNDIKEMEDLILRQKAIKRIKILYKENKEAWDKIVFEHFGYNTKYPFMEMVEEIKKLFSTIVPSDNPYLSEYLPSPMTGGMRIKKILVVENDLAWFVSPDAATKLEEDYANRYKKIEAEKEAKKEAEKKIILDYLKNNFGEYTVSQLLDNCAELSDFTAPHVSALLKELTDKGLVERTDLGKRVLFSIKGYTEQKQALEREKALEQECKKQEKIKELNNKISKLKTELDKQQGIFSVNRNRLFGEGAKIKKAAKLEIATLTNNISQLEAELSNLK